MASEKSKAPSVRETFVRDIENRILSGELKIGEKLPPARALCSLMGVSLTIVNAGVSELVSKGFLEVKPRHGTYVADYREKGTPEALMAIFRNSGNTLSKHDVRSFCESRIALDPFIAELVIKRASDEQIAQLGELVEALKAAEGTEAVCDSVLEFFRRMYRLSDNTLLAMIYNSTVKPQKGMYTLFVEQNGKQLVVDVVEKTYRYLQARDIDGAKQWLTESMRLPLEGSTAIVK